VGSAVGETTCHVTPPAGFVMAAARSRTYMSFDCVGGTFVGLNPPNMKSDEPHTMKRCAMRPMGAPVTAMRTHPLLSAACESIMAMTFGACSSTMTAMPPNVKRKGTCTTGLGTKS
jgi:hypothetical protein